VRLQAGHQVVRYGPVDVDDQQVLLGGPGFDRPALFVDEFQVPAGVRPAQHQQIVLAGFGTALGAPDDPQPEPLDPEPLGGREVPGRTGDADVTTAVHGHGDLFAWCRCAGQRRQPTPPAHRSSALRPGS